MRKELEVRGEELLQLLKRCQILVSCKGCDLKENPFCQYDLIAAARRELEAYAKTNGRATELTANEYQRLALRTAETLKRRSERLLNGLMGLCGESGECIDLLKKYFYQGHDFDEAKLVDELGDVAWYLALAADALGVTLGEVMQKNIDKLRKRYPEGFDAERSRNREEEA